MENAMEEFAPNPYKGLHILGEGIKHGLLSSRERLEEKQKLEALLARRLETLQREIRLETPQESRHQLEQTLAACAQQVEAPIDAGSKPRQPYAPLGSSLQSAGECHASAEASLEAARHLAQVLQFVLNRSK